MAGRRGPFRRRGLAERAVGGHGGVSPVPSLWLMTETFVLKAPCGTDKGCLRRCQPPWAGSLLFLGKGVRARGCQHPEGCRSPGLSQHPVPTPVASGGGQVWSARTGSDRARVSPLLRLQVPRLRARLSQTGYGQTGHMQQCPPRGAGCARGRTVAGVRVVLHRRQRRGA